jgi:hypothetical protein
LPQLPVEHSLGDILETTPSKAVLVVAPGCPPALLQELLGAGVLPRHQQIDVLLPSKDPRAFGQLLENPDPAWRARFLPSPGRHFFSPRHLYWLWENLRPSGHNLLLVADSPYQDPVTAILVLLVLALSGKEIILLFATPEAVIDLSGEGFSERWLSRELNIRVLVKELGRLFWFLQPLNVLYFLMFGGLIVRKKLGEFLDSSKEKSRLRRAA